jgi:hypothetical protein
VVVDDVAECLLRDGKLEQRRKESILPVGLELLRPERRLRVNRPARSDLFFGRPDAYLWRRLAISV